MLTYVHLNLSNRNLEKSNYQGLRATVLRQVAHIQYAFLCSLKACFSLKMKNMEGSILGEKIV